MNKALKVAFKILALVSMLMSIGSVGGMEVGTVTAGQGALRCFGWLLLAIITYAISTKEEK